MSPSFEEPNLRLTDLPKLKELVNRRPRLKSTGLTKKIYLEWSNEQINDYFNMSVKLTPNLMNSALHCLVI